MRVLESRGMRDPAHISMRMLVILESAFYNMCFAQNSS